MHAKSMTSTLTLEEIAARQVVHLQFPLQLIRTRLVDGLSTRIPDRQPLLLAPCWHRARGKECLHDGQVERHRPAAQHGVLQWVNADSARIALRCASKVNDSYVYV